MAAPASITRRRRPITMRVATLDDEIARVTANVEALAQARLFKIEHQNASLFEALRLNKKNIAFAVLASSSRENAQNLINYTPPERCCLVVPFLPTAEAHRDSPLLVAVRDKNFLMVRIILSKLSAEDRYNALIKANTKGATPLLSSVSLGRTHMLEHLIESCPVEKRSELLIYLKSNKVLFAAVKSGSSRTLEIVLNLIPHFQRSELLIYLKSNKVLFAAVKSGSSRTLEIVLNLIPQPERSQLIFGSCLKDETLLFFVKNADSVHYLLRNLPRASRAEFINYKYERPVNIQMSYPNTTTYPGTSYTLTQTSYESVNHEFSISFSAWDEVNDRSVYEALLHYLSEDEYPSSCTRAKIEAKCSFYEAMRSIGNFVEDNLLCWCKI